MQPNDNRKQQLIPTVAAIARYWNDHPTFSMSWYQPGCFACGDWSQRWCKNIEATWRSSGLERCHLVGKAEGGSADVSNIVLLCKRCHRLAPVVASSQQPMIEWINRQEYYLVRRLRRLEEEIRAIRPTLAEEAIALGLNDPDKLEMLMNVAAHSMNIGYHVEGDCIATGAAVLRSVVDALKDKK